MSGKMDEQPQSILDDHLVSNGIHAMYEYVNKTTNSSSTEVFDEPIRMSLQLCYKKIPIAKTTTAIKVVLPHSLVRESTDVCLFVADKNKECDVEETVEHYQELLKKAGIKTIPEVISLKSLRTEYKPYEAKRALSNAYSKFVSDARITHRLPSLLGKNFYGRNKCPTQIDLTKKALKEEYETVLKTTLCTLRGRGSTCCVNFAQSQLSETQAAENLKKVVERIGLHLPGGATNIKSLHIKTLESPAIPVYLSEGSVEDVVLPRTNKRKTPDDFEDVTPVIQGKVRVNPRGHIEIEPFEDSKEDQDDDDVEDNEEIDDDEAEEDDDDDSSDEEPEIKKAKLSKKMVLSEKPYKAKQTNKRFSKNTQKQNSKKVKPEPELKPKEEKKVVTEKKLKKNIEKGNKQKSISQPKTKKLSGKKAKSVK